MSHPNFHGLRMSHPNFHGLRMSQANLHGLRMSQPHSVEEAILSNVKLKLMFRDSLANKPDAPFMVNSNGSNLNCLITEKQGYVSTSIKRNWAKHIDISYNFLLLGVFGGSAGQTCGMIVYLSNNRTLERTSTAVVLGSSSGKVKVNIEPDCSYTVRIVYLSLHAFGGRTEFLVSIHQDSKMKVECTHVKLDIPIFNVSELQQLEVKCRVFTQSHSCFMLKILYFYRNESVTYFSEIQENGGDMVPYIKDMSGDKRCPINGRIDGLFFMSNLDRNSTHPEVLPPCSPFGPMRMIVPTDRFFNFENKLYFSDFFCIKDHYVSLVITKPGSQADLYCQSHLLPLDLFDNPYLRLDISGNVFALHKPGLWVEVMYTETVNINMPGVHFTTVRILGRGKCTRMGIPKNKACRHCNL